MAQALLEVTAHFAAEVLTAWIEPRQQLAGARRLDHRHGAVDRFLHAPGVERDSEMQPLAGVGVDDRDQSRIGDAEKVLIQRDLCGIVRKYLRQAVALDSAEVLCVETLALP